MRISNTILHSVPRTVTKQTFAQTKHRNNSFQSKTEQKQARKHEEKKAEQSFWDRHIGKSDDFGPPKESLVDKANELAPREVVVGGAIGAAVGAGAGYLYGINALQNNEVSIQDVSEVVTTPKLVGADYDHDYWTTEPYTTYYSDGNPHTEYRQVYHPDDWDPIISHLDTGKRRNYRKLVNSSALGPISGAALGAGFGFLTGVAAGALTRALTQGAEKQQKPSYNWYGQYSRTEPKSSRELAADKAPWVGTAVGAVAGGTAGLLAGSLAQERGSSLTQTIMEPVYERHIIGHIPRTSEFRSIPREYFHPGDKLYYDELPESYGRDPFHGSERVVRSVFTGRFEAVESTKNSTFLNPVTGMLAGTAMGAGLGFGVGVATGVLMRMTEEKGARSSSSLFPKE